MKAETKYKGSVKLAAIGDALGWMTEFERNQDGLHDKYGEDYITKFHEWEKQVGGRFYGYKDKIKAGSYSDDTQLLLSVARSIDEKGFIDQNYFSKVELANWLLYSRGAGRTIKNAARKIERKSAKWNKNFFTFKVGKATVDYRQSGANGAAMRVLPIALANFGDIDKIKQEIFENSIITHGHPRAILGAMLYGYAIDTILRFTPDNFDYTAFLTELGKDIDKKLSIPFIEQPELKSWETEWNMKSDISFQESFGNVISETHEYLRNIYISIKNDDSDFDTLSKLGCYRNETKGSGISTVIAGIYLACKYSSQPLNGIERAVNSIGTDTDSIAAFVGGLIGALHGQSIIPKKWKNVQDYEYLDKISTRLLEISENRAKKYKKPVNVNNKKSINIINSNNYKEKEEIYFEPLGSGIITHIDEQDTVTKGKYNLILNVDFNLGQSCIFSKLLNLDKKINIEVHENKFSNQDYTTLIKLISDNDKYKIIQFLLEKLPTVDETKA